MALAKFIAMSLLVVISAAGIRARHVEGAMNGAGRQLLADTDDRFNFYNGQRECAGKSIMVCKSCTATNLEGVAINTRDRGYNIWCFDSGDITNNGDGGLDNWQFSGCFTRDGFQGHNVHFAKC